MKHRFLRLQAIILFALVALFTQTGCRENTVINSKVSPANDSLGVFSVSLPCITHTYYDDTVITSTNIGGIPIYQAIGTVSDPYFGTMTGASYFQLLPANINPAIYDGATIDSAVLVLPYSGFTYGDNTDVNATQTYQVFYMTDTLGYYNTYYSYNTANIDAGSPLSDPTTINVYNLKDSVGLNVLPINYPGLRIKLKLNNIMNRIQTATAVFQNANSTNPIGDWLNAFRGICVRAADPRKFGDAIPYFELDGSDEYSEAGILVYYHTSADTASAYYYFSTGNCAHFNNITKSYSHFPVNNLLHSTSANDPVIALQNQPGTSLDIVVPGIKNLPTGIINKAEIQLTLLPTYANNNPGNVYAAPERLYPVGIGNGNYPTGITAGLTYNVADRYPLTSTSPLTVMDGTLHNIPVNSMYNKFTIDLPREIMASIAAKNDTIHLHLNGTEDFYGAFHMVAGGGSYGMDGTADTIYRAKLFVVYSKLN